MNRDLFISDVKRLGRQYSPEEFPERLADYVKGMPTDERHTRNEPSVDYEKVLKVCQSYFKVSHEKLVEKNKERAKSYPRQVAIYLLFRRTRIGVKNVGKIFNRDPSTVSHNFYVVRDLMDSDATVRAEVEGLNAQL